MVKITRIKAVSIKVDLPRQIISLSESLLVGYGKVLPKHLKISSNCEALKIWFCFLRFHLLSLELQWRLDSKLKMLLISLQLNLGDWQTLNINSNLLQNSNLLRFPSRFFFILILPSLTRTPDISNLFRFLLKVRVIGIQLYIWPQAAGTWEFDKQP